VSAPKRDWREWQAGYACGSILMPARKTKEVVQEWRKNWTGSTTEARQTLISLIATTFEVSKQAAEVRLRVLEQIDESTVLAA
jgi:hypothetical protein